MADTWRWLRWAVGALAMAGAAQAQVTLTDDRGVAVRFEHAPQRIVSLLPSLTESVCALGECARLVGVDRYSNWPERVKALPQLGGGLDPQVELVLALRPDVVLAAHSSRAVARLENLGLKVLALEPRNHADARRVFDQLGQLLGVTDAPRLWRQIEAGVAAAAQSVAPALRGQKVYFEVNRGPYAAGPASFIGETLTRLGMANIVPAGLGPFPQINPELVVQARPDFILIGERGPQALEDRPGWRALPALQARRLCQFTPEQADVLVRPGPRMDEAARLMADCFNRVGARRPATRP